MLKKKRENEKHNLTTKVGNCIDDKDFKVLKM